MPVSKVVENVQHLHVAGMTGGGIQGWAGGGGGGGGSKTSPEGNALPLSKKLSELKRKLGIQNFGNKVVYKHDT